MSQLSLHLTICAKCATISLPASNVSASFYVPSKLSHFAMACTKGRQTIDGCYNQRSIISSSACCFCVLHGCACDDDAASSSVNAQRLQQLRAMAVPAMPRFVRQNENTHIQAC
jgi:hypothetical protein